MGIVVKIGEPESVSVEIKNAILNGSGSSCDPYKGPYTVKPKAYENTILQTKGKGMGEDVTVLEIPNFLVSNESGKTFIIG